MMIARKSILNKSKLSSGASLVSTTPWRHTESSKMTARMPFIVGAQKLIQYNIIRPSHLTFAHQLEMNVRGAPARLPVKKWPWFATSPVTFENTPKKATRSTSTTHSRIICCEIFGLKYLVLSLHRSTAQISLKAGLIFSSFSMRNYTGYLGTSPETYTHLTGGYHGDKHREGIQNKENASK